MSGRRLLVRTRPEPPSGDPVQKWTLFARLSPPTARALLENVDNPDFMPLCLSVDGLDDPIYVSYNGGTIIEDGKNPILAYQHPLFALPLMNAVHKLSLPLNLDV